MRIGIFVEAYEPAINGCGVSVKSLEEGLKLLGHEVFIFAPRNLIGIDIINKMGDFEFTPPTAKHMALIPGKRIPFLGDKDYILSVQDNISFVEKYKLDIVHIQTEYFVGQYASIACKKLDIPCVYTFHTFMDEHIRRFNNPFFNRIHFNIAMSIIKYNINSASSAADVCICPTSKCLSVVDEYDSLRQTEKIVIPSGIKLEKFDPENIDKEEVKKLYQKYHIPEDSFIFLCVGRLAPEKRVNELTEAVCQVLKKYSNAHFLVVGYGSCEDTMKEIVSNYNVTSQVTFTGAVSNDVIPLYYNMGNVFVCVSQSETQGMTYAEALASGTPIVVFNDECLDIILKNNFNGFGVDSDEEFIEKIELLLNNKSIYENIKRNTVPSIQHLSIKKFGENAVEAYQKAIYHHKIKNQQQNDNESDESNKSNDDYNKQLIRSGKSFNLQFLSYLSDKLRNIRLTISIILEGLSITI